MTQSRVGILLLERLATVSSVGLFSSAVTLTAGLAMIPDSLSTAAYPRLCAATQQPNLQLFGSIAGRVVLTNATIGVAVGAVLFVLAEPILGVLYGSAFRHAASALRVLSVGYLFGAVACVGGDSINALGRPAINMLVVGLGLAVTILVTIRLVPSFGITGAATAYALGMLIMAVCIWVGVWVTFRQRSSPNLGRRD